MKKKMFNKDFVWRMVTAILVLIAGIYALTCGLCLINILYFIEGLAAAIFVITWSKPKTRDKSEPCSLNTTC